MHYLVTGGFFDDLRDVIFGIFSRPEDALKTAMNPDFGGFDWVNVRVYDEDWIGFLNGWGDYSEEPCNLKEFIFFQPAVNDNGIPWGIPSGLTYPGEKWN